jgi:hypothetical protein
MIPGNDNGAGRDGLSPRCRAAFAAFYIDFKYSISSPFS